MTARRRIPAIDDRRRVSAPLVLLAAASWVLLALGDAGLAVPAICSGEQLWSVPSTDSLTFALTFLSPGALALGWIAMLTAMMLPTLGGPIVHVLGRSFRRTRHRSVALFVAAYIAVWLMAGPVFVGAALLLRLSAAEPTIPLVAALVAALIWQASPVKQRALNRCHQRPALAAFAPAAYRDALRFGLVQGLWCLASCWALMLAALLAPGWHLAAMAAASVVIWAERLDRPAEPAWRLRLPLRAARIARVRLVPRWPLAGGRI